MASPVPPLAQAARALEAGDPAAAVRHARAALKREPANLLALKLLTQALLLAGDAAEAARQAARIAKREPGDPRNHNMLGQALAAAGDHLAALAVFTQVPDFPDAAFNAQISREALGQHRQILAEAPRLRALCGPDPDAALIEGRALLALGEAEKAITVAEAVLQADPRSADAWALRGSAQAKLGRVDGAAESFARAMQLRPDDALFPARLGNLLVTAQRFAEALPPLQRALHLRPDDVAALVDAGMALSAQARWQEALALLDRAAALNPDDTVVRLNRADAFLNLRRFVEAAADCAHVRRRHPGDADAAIGLLHAHQNLALWDGIEALAADAIALGGALLPLSLLAATDDPAAALRAARDWVRKELQYVPAAPAIATRRQPGPIRIAYVSPDLGDHPVGILIAGLIEAHDRTRFETIGVAIGPARSGVLHDRLRAGFGRFIDAEAMTDAALAARLRAEGIDIAVDLAGFTAQARPRLFALRPAPVQVNFLGMSASMGSPAHDYIVVDPVVAPPGSEAQFDECVMRLPYCYMPTDRARAIAAVAPSRAACGLSDGAFVFAAFNAVHKITPEVFSAWCRLLGAVPGSQLWLSHPPAEARANLLREAAARGVSADRIVFAERVDYPEHLARTALADLALDTFPYTGATTACDALWAGLPMLTRVGRSFNARVAASLLHAIGLPELVTETLPEYEALAVALAREPARLHALRERLAANRLTTPLFDTEGYTRALEHAFTQAAERARAGLPPAAIG
ncbi:tetratricopeptide repeat protein [Roseomonas hellenica]|uniref:protein O-GlcNAc transferase n=1 Tax=Plastoroseomonas hellenica TaxID=2687306 RepID=A0ABS5F692_9PROT|nr:tetratricopeptide repeat protein [Plastoroseomonas hellenica]